jgi:pyrroline-5-carboxylate reductase
MKMQKLKIGVFGCGNMGQALVIGMRSQFPNAEFFLYTPSQIKAQALANIVKGKSLETMSEMPRDLDWYLLAFKPQNLEDFHFDFAPEAKIISVLAGVNTTKLQAQLKVLKIARLMPNTPSAIGAGASLQYLTQYFVQTEVGELNSLLSSTGVIYPMTSENDLDLTTAFSGSGPALIFEMARIFEEELTRMTYGRVPAREIVLQTFLGSAQLMNHSKNANSSFLELRNQVTSKKGVTYEALLVLKEHNLQEIFKEAFEAAYKRTIELSQ